MPDRPYNRPSGRRKYLSRGKHQVNSKHTLNGGKAAAKWISYQVEIDLFDYADYGNFQKLNNGNQSWECDKGHLWSLSQDKEYVGQQGEQFAFFEKPVNVTDEWHGFPIIPFSNTRYQLSDSLLIKWVTQGVIDAEDIPDIKRRKRI